MDNTGTDTKQANATKNDDTVNAEEIGAQASANSILAGEVADNIEFIDDTTDIEMIEEQEDSDDEDDTVNRLSSFFP